MSRYETCLIVSVVVPISLTIFKTFYHIILWSATDIIARRRCIIRKGRNTMGAYAMFLLGPQI